MSDERGDEQDGTWAGGGAAGADGGSVDAALGRLRAARRASDDPSDPAAATAEHGDEFADLLRSRMAERRVATGAARHVASVYAAAHGHVPDAGDAGGRRRWALRPRAAIAAVVAVLVLGAATAVAVAWPRDDVRAVAPVTAIERGEPVAEAAADVPESLGTASPAPSSLPGVVVHVVGQVERPGLVTLPAGSRVADAVDAAGGATRKADLGAVNLARAVVDGEQLRVPAPGETVPAEPAGPAVPAAPAGSAPGSASTGPVDLNTADEAALDTLPGIGPALAGRIVAWRQENGGFGSVDELDEVSGIGPALLDGLRDLVRV